MALPSTLPISRLINVSVSLLPTAAQSQNLSSLLILGTSTVIDVVSRMRSYNTINAVATDFGTSAPEYLAAVLWFEQNPQPQQLLIGRWAKTASSGQLFCGTLSAANTLLTAWTSINNAAFKIQVDSGSLQSIVALNLSSAQSLAGVAGLISAAITGAVCTYDAVNNRFIFTSNTTGATSTVSFLTAGASGTDISAQLVGTNLAGNGAYVANGIVAESALAATTIFDTTFGQQWYGLTIPQAVDADHIAVAGFIEATANKHYYGVTTQEAGALLSTSTTDIAFVLQALGYNKTAVQYSSTNTAAIVSMLARILPTDYSGNQTVITLMYKQEPGITPENLTATQANALATKNCNVFVAYNNNTAIIQNGTSVSGQFVDTVVGADAFAIAVQTAVYNLLFTIPTKVPQTDRGMHLITTAITGVCIQFVNDGYLAAGNWTSAGFGALNTNDAMPGYYVYAPPVSTQSQASRAARIAVPIQIAAKLAGAVHSANVAITVNP
jgi:hypothetical protein